MRSWSFCRSRAHLGLSRGEVGQLRLLLGCELLDRLPDGLGPGRDLGRLFHRLLLLLEQLLGILHDTPVRLELAKAIQHFLEFFGDRFLIRLGLGQRLASGILPRRWFLVTGRLLFLGATLRRLSALIARLGTL